MKILDAIFLLILSCVVIVAGTMVGYGKNVQLSEVLLGISIIFAVGVTGYLIAKLPVFNKLPSIVWISATAIFVSSSAFPWSRKNLWKRLTKFLLWRFVPRFWLMQVFRLVKTSELSKNFLGGLYQ